jgi:hypothetical protein
MFDFSANHLSLLSQKEYPSCAVLPLLDRDTQRYRRTTSSSPPRARPGHCVAGKVNSADKLYRVVESIRPIPNARDPPLLQFELTAQEVLGDGLNTSPKETSPVRGGLCQAGTTWHLGCAPPSHGTALVCLIHINRAACCSRR